MGKPQATVAEDTVKEKVEGRAMSVSKRKSIRDGHSGRTDGLPSRNHDSGRSGHPVGELRMLITVFSFLIHSKMLCVECGLEVSRSVMTTYFLSFRRNADGRFFS